MSRVALFVVVGVVGASVFACTGFTGDSPSPSPSPTADPDSGAPSPDSGLPSVGTVFTGISVTAGDGKTLFMVQSRTATVPVKLERKGSSTGPVAIKLTKVPTGTTVDALTIPAGATDGTLTLHVGATTPQGPFALELIATELVDNGATGIAMLDTFVRGLPGTLDTTFGTGGVVKQVFASGTSGASDVQVMLNGDIVVAGHRTNTLTLVRYTPDGVLDTTFGGGTGRANVITAQGSLFFDIHEGATPADGFISSLSYGTVTAVVARTTLDGTPDTKFNNTGQAPVTLGLGNLNGIQTFALSSGDALVLTYHFTNKLAVVSRWKSNGTLDSTYGTSGTCQLSATGTGSTLGGTSGMLLHPDGSVWVALNLASGAVKGCSATGGVDMTVGTAPDYFASFYPSGQMVPNVGGGFVFLGATSWSRANAGFVADTGIGNFGSVSVAPLTNARWPVVQPDGAVVVLGDLSTAPAGSFTLRRFKQNSMDDPEFGTAGTATIAIGTNTYAAAKLIAQPDGRLLVVGTQDDNFDGFLARVWN